jgi:hypothetical protein
MKIVEITFQPGTTYWQAREAIEPIPGWHAADHASTPGSKASLWFFDDGKATAAAEQLKAAAAVAVIEVSDPPPPRQRKGRRVSFRT